MSNIKSELFSFLATIEEEYVLVAALDAARKAMLEQSKTNKTYISVRENIAVYRNSSSRFWWVSIKTGEKGAAPIRKSLKEENLNTAIAKAPYVAENLLKDYEMGKISVRKKGALWSSICKEVVEKLKEKEKEEKATGKKKPQSSEYINQITNYLMELWPRKQLYEISYPEIADWLDSSEFPVMSNTWARNHNKAIRIVFEHAVRNRVIAESQVPTIPKMRTKEGEEGIPFETSDRGLFLSNFEGFVEDAKKYGSKFLRSQFPFYFQILCASGLRPGEEVLGLCWHDLEATTFEYGGKKKKAYTVTVRFGKMAKETHNKRGKKKESRTILINAACVEAFERLYYVQTGIEKNIKEIINENKSAYIFLGIEGNRPNFLDVFAQYKKYVETIRPLKEYYKLYSCRHEYINAELDRGISAQDISDQVGNSPSTIHKYYKKYRASKRAARILSYEDILKFNPVVSLEKRSASISTV